MRFAIFAAGATCILTAAAPSGAAKRPRDVAVIAKSGDPAPGSGEAMLEFRTPTINAAGDVAFGATLPDLGTGFEEVTVLSRDGELDLVARAGVQAPGLEPGILFHDLSPPYVDDAGRAYQNAQFEIAPLERKTGIWRLDPGGSLALLVATGQEAPGTAWEFAGVSLHATGPAGHLVLKANPDSLWEIAPGGSVPALLMLTGSEAPGTSPPVPFHVPGSPLLNGSGAVAFAALLDDAPSPSGLPLGVWWAEAGGELALLVETGAPAPGMPSGTVFDRVELSDLGESGAVVLHDDTLGGIWVGTPGDLRLVALQDTPAPTGAPGDRYLSFSDGFVDASDRVVFFAHLDPDVTVQTRLRNDETLWRASANGGAELLLREGQTIGDGSGARIAEIYDYAVADHGSVVCSVRIRGAQDGRNDAILYLAPSGERRVLVREGDRFRVGPGDRRRVRRIRTWNGRIHASGVRVLNDAGQVAMTLDFADDTQAVVVMTVP